ncbi:synaptopodin 2-like protein [Coregonus clupeaformis]|uniref:synaptopodin 2-like protein n=1 Tax=Coregonus clupeaformis TaxID=59861 RepID=UPI001E1C5ECB|nr:synaptopodin 2-like protein [Coregonus clupeaformis]
MVAEEVVVTLSGGAPWGFRLQGGVEHQTPLQVAKVRRRSKACRADLREEDELIAIGDHVCAELNHAQAMMLIDSHRHTLNLRVKRSGFHSVVLSGRTHTATHPVLFPTEGPSCFTLTSPPDSEAYYGETDSDADTQTRIHRRQRHTPPHARSPGHQQEEEETSEISGYESAPDGGLSLQCPWEQLPTLGNGGIQQWEQSTGSRTGGFQPGVPRREVVYQPKTPQARPEWTHPAQPVPHHAKGEPVGGGEVEGEGDSGFQEAGGCLVLACSPLVSPERAKGAMMLGSSPQMVPMVGAQLTPLSDELSTTYKEKARQAKLQRGDNVVDRQVKEARTKCRSIASLLTDAPNSNSKGVLMFKKRRQRAKKYTLTCFGRAEGEMGPETGGETEGEEEEGSSFPSGSEVDEEGFAGTFDPTWDSGYLDMLDRRSSACPSTYNSMPQTPTNQSSGLDSLAFQSPEMNMSFNQGSGMNAPAYQSPGLDSIAYQSKETEQYEQQRKMAAPVTYNSAPNTSPATGLSNGGSAGVSRASVVLTPPSHTPIPPQPDLNLNPNLPGGIHNRTARPFTSGLAPSRPPATPVNFRPVQPTPAITMVSKPTAAVSMVTIAPPRPSGGPEARRGFSSTSLYIPPRPAASILSPPPSVLSPPLTQPPPPLTFNPYVSMTTPAMVTPSTAQTPASDSLSSREQRIAVPASRTGILAEARHRSNKKPMFRPSVENKKDVSPNPALLELLQNPDAPARIGPGPMGPSGGVSWEAGGESGPEEDWLKLGAEACNFMQAQRGSKPPPVAPKPQPPPQVPQLAGKGGQLFARRQSRMDRYVVETPSSPQPCPSHPRQPSPTPSLPSQFKYSSSCRAPPPINYNPLLSPSCPPQAQRQRVGVAGQGGVSAGHKAAPGGQKAQGIKALDFMSHQPYQLNSSLFSYGGGTPQGQNKMPCVYEVKRFSTPPPTGPVPTVIIPRSATTLGEPMWRSDVISLPPTATSCYQFPTTPPYQPQPQWVPPPPAPTAPLPQLPSFSSAHVPNPHPYPSQPHAPQQGNSQFKSAPDLSPLAHTPPRPASTQPSRVPRPRFSTSNLGLQPSVWRPGSTMS